MADDGGVLGNLPNSRPGKRSEKRNAGAGRPAKSAARAAKKAERSGAGPKPAQRKRTAAVKKPGSGDGVGVVPDMHGTRRHDPVPPPRDQVPPSPAEDPVGAVVRTAAGVAATGVRVAGAVSRELLKRLPRL